jgi:hypothetical protein
LVEKLAVKNVVNEKEPTDVVYDVLFKNTKIESNFDCEDILGQKLLRNKN